MPVSATTVICAANAWTMVATGAASTVMLKGLGSTRLLLVPTDSNVAPANADNALPLEAFEESNLASDSGTYWWVRNTSADPVSVRVWKL